MATTANYARQASAVGARPAAQVVKKKKTPGAKKIVLKELPAFTRQMAAMIDSGMPIVQTLEAQEVQASNKVFKDVIRTVRTQIEGGSSLSEALAKFPDVFSELYVGMLRAGELGGMLADTAARLAAYLEAQARLRRKVISAMMYPCIVTVVALLLTAGMVIWIVPAFASIYEDFDAALPGPTQFLVNVSDFSRAYAPYVVAFLTVIFISIGRFKKTERGAFFFDGLALRLPVFGPLINKVSLSRFASTFAQMTRSGVPILTSLEITAVATGNRVLGKTVADAAMTVERGEPLSSALIKDKNFPPMLIQMLSAGESTGKVDEMLQKISEFYEDEVDATLSGLTSLIEPLLIVFLGLLIGSIVLCMFMPIFKMHEIVNF
jgi:type IV pilus assembly protein PilC